jgi:hypothetical protein
VLFPFLTGISAVVLAGEGEAGVPAGGCKAVAAFLEGETESRGYSSLSLLIVPSIHGCVYCNKYRLIFSIFFIK